MVTGSLNGAQPQPDPLTGPARTPPTPPEPPARRSGGRPRWPLPVLRAGLTLATVVLVLAVVHGGPGRGPHPAAAPATVLPVPPGRLPAPGMAPADRPPGAVPVALTIPVISLRTRLVRLDAGSGGTLHSPADPAVAGWYGGGPYPGDATSPPALIVGRAGTPTRRGVFARLGELRPGNSVLVVRADGRTAAFEVYRVARYPGPGLPSGRIYAPARRAELRLVTCPGPGEAAAGGVAVYAALRGPTDQAGTGAGTPAG